MTKPPLVSVILPSFNHRRFIAESINSILRQTYQNIQLIVIDDGSTDGSTELIAELAAVHGFLYIAQANAGLVATVNRAKQMVEGKYVALTASDDFFHSKKIERLVDFLEKNPDYAVVHSNLILVDDDSKEVGRVDNPCPSGMIFGPMLRGEFHVNGLSALIRADVFQQYTYGDFYVEDLYMWLSIAERYPIAYLDEHLAYYRRHNNHATGNADKMMAGEKAVLDYFSNKPEYPEAVMCWREKWFFQYVSQRKNPAIRKKAYSLGKDLLHGRRFKGSILKGLIRLMVASIQSSFASN